MKTTHYLQVLGGIAFLSILGVAVYSVRAYLPLIGGVFLVSVGIGVGTIGPIAVLGVIWLVLHLRAKHLATNTIHVQEHGTYVFHQGQYQALLPASVHVASFTGHLAERRTQVTVEAEEPKLLAPVTLTLPQAPAFAAVRPLVRPDRLVMCYTGNNEPVYGSVDDLLSTNVNGKPGRGKTSLLYFIIAQLLISQADVTVFDPHGSMTELDQMFTYIDNYEEMSEHVPQVEQMLRSRLEAFKARRDVGKPHLFIVDEAPAIAAWEIKQRQLYKQKVRETPHNSILQLVQTIILEARKLRVYVIIAGQSMPATVLPTIARDNLSSHYVFFSSDGHAKMAGLEKDDIDDLLPQLKSAGPGLCVFDAARLSEAEIGAIPQTTIEDLLELVPNTDKMAAQSSSFSQKRPMEQRNRAVTGELVEDVKPLQSWSESFHEDVKDGGSIPAFTQEQERQIMAIAQTMIKTRGKVIRSEIPGLMNPAENNRIYPAVKYICNREGW